MYWKEKGPLDFTKMAISCDLMEQGKDPVPWQGKALLAGKDPPAELWLLTCPKKQGHDVGRGQPCYSMAPPQCPES